MMKLVLKGAALILPLALAACGDGKSDDAGANGAATSATAQPGAAGDPCGLVTKEDVSAATGETIVEAKSDGDRCTYQTDDAMAASVEVEIKRSGGAEEMDIARRAAGALADIGEGMKDRSGAEADVGNALTSGGAAKLGDSAFFGPNEQLHVLKGDAYVAVTPPTMRSRMSGGNPMLSADDKRKMAMAVAEKVLAKL